MAGAFVPVEPRRRYTYIFSAERPLSEDLPLTIGDEILGGALRAQHVRPKRDNRTAPRNDQPTVLRRFLRTRQPTSASVRPSYRRTHHGWTLHHTRPEPPLLRPYPQRTTAHRTSCHLILTDNDDDQNGITPTSGALVTARVRSDVTHSRPKLFATMNAATDQTTLSQIGPACGALVEWSTREFLVQFRLASAPRAL